LEDDEDWGKFDFRVWKAHKALLDAMEKLVESEKGPVPQVARQAGYQEFTVRLNEAGARPRAGLQLQPANPK
jgi:hypothetical protein